MAKFLAILEKEAHYYECLIKKGSSIFIKKKETQEIDDYIEKVLKDFVNSEISVERCVELLTF